MTAPDEPVAATGPTDSHARNVVLGVAGGIAAYKAVSLLRLLREAGHVVRVVPTPSALTFVGAATWEALSGQPVRTGVFDAVTEVEHVTLGRHAGLVVVAPATADLLARATAGRADDLLTACLLTTRAPVVLVPAMHTEMWEHPATRANVARLRERGTVVLDPATGRLTGSDSGAGRLPEPDEIYAALRGFLTLPRDRRGVANRTDLAGRHVLVTAGGTREPLDPVRFLTNRSSGRQGFAVAAAAAARGADVHVIAANTSAAAPAGVRVTRVETTQELADAVTAAAPLADVVVMAAAPSDYRPAQRSAAKIKKTGSRTGSRGGRRGAKTPGTLTLELVETPDILAALTAARRPGQVIVGFAAETGDDSGTPLDYGRIKLAAKGADLMLVNEVGVGVGFGTAENSGTLLGSDGSVATVPSGPKESVGHVILDAAARRLLDTPASDHALT